jgi:hypothetical protein
MYDRGKELHIPWMAGSSLTVGFRDPDVELPFGTKLARCLAVGYSGLDIYGFHTLDFLQATMERRRGAEQGVAWVEAHPVSSLGRLVDRGWIPTDLLAAALRSSRTDRDAVANTNGNEDGIFLIQYRDGMLVPVLMLNQTADGISVAFEDDSGKIVATRAEERVEPRYPHFAYLLKGVEEMIFRGRPVYPVERTLLAAGVLDRSLKSRMLGGGIRIETPELAISYQGSDYPHAPHIDLNRLP